MKKGVIKKIGDKEDKRTYKKEKDYHTDMTYENEINKYLFKSKKRSSIRRASVEKALLLVLSIAK